MKILCIGEAMIELSISPEGNDARIGVAGDVLNSAIYLRRALGREHSVEVFTALGTDSMSDKVLRFMDDHDVGTRPVVRDAERSVGLYSIQLDSAGERSFSYWRGQSAARTMFGDGDADRFDVLDDADVVYFSAISLAILSPRVRERFLEVVARRKQDGLCVAFDSNYRPGLWENRSAAMECVERAWSVADIGLPSIDDEMALFEEDRSQVINRLREYPLTVCVLKRGAAGPVLIAPWIEEPADGVFQPAANVVDTTGAGDSFNGRFLAEYLRDPGALTQAMSAAHRVAREVVGHNGAIAPGIGWRDSNDA